MRDELARLLRLDAQQTGCACGVPRYRRGSPRTRSAMMLRWISLVPEKIVTARVDRSRSVQIPFSIERGERAASCP